MRVLPCLQVLVDAAQQRSRRKTATLEFASPLVIQARRRHDRHAPAGLYDAMGQRHGNARLAHADFVGQDRTVLFQARGQLQQARGLAGVEFDPLVADDVVRVRVHVLPSTEPGAHCLPSRGA